MPKRTRIDHMPEPARVIARLMKKPGVTVGHLAQRLGTTAPALQPRLDEMVRDGQIVTISWDRWPRYYAAGTQPGANGAPMRRITSFDDKRDITESTYCVDFARHRALAELLRVK